MAAGIAASGSRGPVAHLLLAAVVLLVFVPEVSSKVRLMVRVGVMSSVAVLVVTLIVGPVVGERYSTIFDPESFFWKWFGPLKGGLQVALEHPFGMGLGYTAGVPQFIHDPIFQDLPTTNVDSGYGAAAAELGLVGLLLFAYLAAKVGLEGLRAWKALPPGRMKDLFLGPMLMALTYPIVSVIFQPQAGLPSSIYFWLLMGMLVAARTRSQEGHADRVLRAEMYSRE
jgi:O-antigen ligase